MKLAGRMPKVIPGQVVAWYVGLVASAATGLAAFLLIEFGSPSALEVLFFGLLALLADATQVEVPMGPVGFAAGARRRQPALSASFLVLLTAALATEPQTALLVGLISGVPIRDTRGPVRAVFNAAQAAIYTGSACLLFNLGQRASEGPLLGIGAALLASFSAVALNTLLVAGAVAIERQWPFVRAIHRLLWPTPYTISFAFPAYVIAVLYGSVEGLGVFAAAFLLTPLLVLRKARAGKLELDEARDRTLRAFVRTVELKDPYTRRHSERVAAIAIEIHRELGTPERDLVQRYYGALLHDIGKVAIPAAVLTKPGRLLPEEYDLIKVHPALGASAVSEISFLRVVAPEILSHHERIDGHGYPRKLRGEEIPFEARVLAVADTFEALTSRRPYRPEMSHEAALREIVRCSGSQLDGHVVAALRRVLAKGSLFSSDSPRLEAPTYHAADNQAARAQ